MNDGPGYTGLPWERRRWGTLPAKEDGRNSFLKGTGFSPYI